MPHVIFNWHQLTGSVCLRPAATAAPFLLVSLSGLLCWGRSFAKTLKKNFFFNIQLQFHVNSTFRHILENWRHVQPLSAISVPDSMKTSLNCTFYWTSEVNIISHFFSTVRVGTHTALSEQLEKGSSSSDEVGYFHPGLSYTKGYFRQCHLCPSSWTVGQ